MLNAGRKYLGLESLAGKVFLTSGLGGMSGAQAKVRKKENNLSNLCQNFFYMRLTVESRK